MVIGITGIYGAGKSAVVAMLRKKGLPVISADRLVYGILRRRAVRETLVKRFGSGILDERGRISRPKLGKEVFADTGRRKYLEGVVHPAVFEAIEKRIFDLRRKGCTIIPVEVPLLFETQSQHLFDKTVVVHADPGIIAERLKDIPRAEIAKRWRAQLPQDKKKALADFLIDNSGSYSHTRRQVEKILHTLKEQ